MSTFDTMVTSLLRMNDMNAFKANHRIEIGEEAQHYTGDLMGWLDAMRALPTAPELRSEEEALAPELVRRYPNRGPGVHTS